MYSVDRTERILGYAISVKWRQAQPCHWIPHIPEETRVELLQFAVFLTDTNNTHVHELMAGPVIESIQTVMKTILPGCQERSPFILSKKEMAKRQEWDASTTLHWNRSQPGENAKDTQSHAADQAVGPYSREAWCVVPQVYYHQWTRPLTAPAASQYSG